MSQAWSRSMLASLVSEVLGLDRITKLSPYEPHLFLTVSNVL